MRRGFSPSLWLRRTDGLQPLQAGNAGHVWVLSRSFCVYSTLDGAAVPPRKRQGFVDMAIARWAPFTDPQSHVEWVGDRAMVWTWSKAQALADADGAMAPPPRRCVPETLYRGQPHADGEELVAMAEGVEGRVWRDGALAASRTWPEPPQLEEWNEFRRGAGLPPAHDLPDTLSYPLAEQPWRSLQAGNVGEMIGQQRELFAMVAAGCVAAVLGALLVGALSLKVSIWQVNRDIAQREQAMSTILDARDKAQADAAAAQKLLALRPPGGQIELLATVSGLMRGPWQLLQWRMPNADRLELKAKMKNADPRAIVTAWEKSGRFTEVSATGNGPEEVLIKARILRRTSGGAH